MVNVIYFSLTSMVALRIPSGEGSESGLEYWFSLAAFVFLVFIGEMLPKSIGIMRPRAIASVVGLPMTMMVRALDPVMPIMRSVSLISRRVLWPGLREEPALQVADLERAIELSRQDGSRKFWDRVAETRTHEDFIVGAS